MRNVTVGPYGSPSGVSSCALIGKSPAWLTTAWTSLVSLRPAAIVSVADTGAVNRALLTAESWSRTTTAWSRSLEIVIGIVPRRLARVMMRRDDEMLTAAVL